MKPVLFLRLAAGFLLLPYASALAADLINETFSGKPANEWFLSAGSARSWETPGADGTGRAFVAGYSKTSTGAAFLCYFPGVTLRLDQTLTVSFLFKADAYGAKADQNQLAIGFYNSGSPARRISGDSADTDPAFTAYAGLQARWTGFDPGAPANSGSLRRRIGGAPFIYQGSAHSQFGATRAGSATLIAADPDIGPLAPGGWTPLQTLAVTRTKAGYRISGGVGGNKESPAAVFGPQEVVDGDTPPFFDTLSIWVRTGVPGSRISIDNVRVFVSE